MPPVSPPLLTASVFASSGVFSAIAVIAHKLLKLPLRAALREVPLRAMLQDIESAFPKTFSAVSTEGSKVQDFAAFSEERKAEIVYGTGKCTARVPKKRTPDGNVT